MKNVKKIFKNSVYTSRKTPEFMLHYLVRSQFVPISKALGPEMTLEWLKITRSQKHRKWATIRPICGQNLPLSNLTEIFTQSMFLPSLMKIGPILFKLLNGQAHLTDIFHLYTDSYSVKVFNVP